MAVSGNYGVFEGIDYRDVPVLAATRPVPQTSWSLISKVDREEIYAPLRQQTRIISLVITLLIAVAGLSIVFRWRKVTQGMEAALKKRNAFIEKILNNLPIGLAVNTIKDGKTIYLNAKFEEIYGWPQHILVDVNQFFIHVYPDPDYRRAIQEKIQSDIAGNDPSRMRWENVPITTETGESKFVTAINIPLAGQGLMISTVLDVTARTKAEQALIENERRYKRLVESVTDYIYTVELDKGVSVKTTHGPGCVTVTGYTSEEFQADPGLWLRMIFEVDRKAILELTDKLNSGEMVPPFEHRIIHKNGSIRWVRNTPVPRYDNEGRLGSYDGMISDITPVKLLENQLRQAQKMEAVGQLAGGIAHDFNNILTAIIGYSHLLLIKLAPEHPGRHYAEQIISSSERASHLTHSLLAFSRNQIINLKPVNMNDIVRQVEKLLTRVIGEDIDFKTSLSTADPQVLADGVQIEQVLMNLAANARDAMPDGGAFLIETSEQEMGEEYIRANSFGKPGTYACISVTDTGVGMDETTRTRLFEPFYTTKEVGKGTGLGLSMVYGIVKQHNGYINVSSEPGKGANFKIYLPLITGGIDGKPSAAESAPIERGSETILLAEDDATVRHLTRTVLEDGGYKVIEAIDGEDAVQKFSQNRDAVDLLALDIIMPRKNGSEAYQEIKKLRPGIKALFMSGYTADIVSKKGILETGMEVLLKPILPQDLLRKVRAVLDAK